MIRSLRGPGLPLPVRPPGPCESFPRPRARGRGRAGAQRGREGPGAGSHGRARRGSQRLLFKVTVRGLRAGQAVARARVPLASEVRQSHPCPAAAALSASSSLPPADSFSRQRHRHGYLIRPYFLIEMGPKEPGAGLARRGGGGEGAAPGVQTHFATSRRPRPRSRGAPTRPAPPRPAAPPPLFSLP